MTDQTPPDYSTIQGLYPYGQIFMLLHTWTTPSNAELFAFGDLIGARRDYWSMVTVMLYGYQENNHTPAPLLCPASSDWEAGYEAAKDYADQALAGHNVNQGDVIAAHGTNNWFFQAGLIYYAWDTLTPLPTLSVAGLLGNLVNFLENL